MSFLPQFLVAMSTKAAIGLATAGLVLGGGTAATIATRTANPVTWGQDVVNTLQQCKTMLPSGDRNVGQCVSAFAKTHGAAERAKHSPGASAGGMGIGRPTAPGSQGAAHASGKPGSLPAEATAPHPSGRPQGLPSGHSSKP